MERSLGILLLLICTLAIIHVVQAQSQRGFISLDCGLPANETSPYKEDKTGLMFSSDATFIQSGKTGRIQENRSSDLLKSHKTLRSFPDGIPNCYNLIVDKGHNYLIRASFLYGNYDGLDISPKFDVYIGPNPWVTIDLERLGNGTREEILHFSTSNSLQICLVKNGTTTPLISTLELRPLREDLYATRNSGSLKLLFRYYLSNSTSRIRFPDDVYDRQWIAYSQTDWTLISTTLKFLDGDVYGPPKFALTTAATPTNASAPLKIEWNSANPDDQFYLYAHVVEIQDLQSNVTREFDILWNGLHYDGPLIPDKLVINTLGIHSSDATCDDEWRCSLQLVRTNRSTLPPLLNAIEVYTVIKFPQSETDEKEGIDVTFFSKLCT